MGYLGIDTVGSRRLAIGLANLRPALAAAGALVTEAELLADLDSGVIGLLDEIDRSLAAISATITRAVDEAEGFRLPVSWTGPPFPAPSPKPGPATGRPVVGSGLASAGPGSVPTPTPTPTPFPVVAAGTRPEPPAARPASPRWNATPSTPWNQVHQEASHNSYEVTGGIAALHRHGVRSFELDIHRGAPTDLWPGPAPSWMALLGPAVLGPALSIWLDARSHGGGRPDDWQVYHHSADPGSEYEYLSDGLRAIAELESSDPVTVFVDNKDRFGGTHDSEQLDRLLVAALGAKLFTPGDLLDRAPHAGSLQQAVDRAGWPTADELEGRVLVVLTAEVEGYERDGAIAFVAANPVFATDASGERVHVASPNVVFYNESAAALDQHEIAAVQGGGNVLRTYGASVDGCPGEPAPNYRAVDHTFPEPPERRCPRPEPVPTPVPRPSAGPPLSG